MVSFVGGRRIYRAVLSVAPELLATVGLLALIWWGAWWTLAGQYASAMNGAARDTANLARAFEENTRRIIAGGDQVLLGLRAAYNRHPDRFDLDQWVKNENAPDWLTAQIAIIGADGMSIASTASKIRVSVADREHFTSQRASTADELLISKPVIGRSSKKWTVQLTRKILDESGKFAGIVVLSVDCYQLSGFYETLNLDEGYMALAGTDGIVRARGPVTDDVIGVPLQKAGLPAELLASGHGTTHVQSPRGGVTVSHRRLSSYPLVVAVAFADKPVLAGYRRARLGVLWSGGLATIAIFGIGMFWIRQRQRSIASQEALALTLESMNQGLVMIDGSKRVRVVNGRALQLLGMPKVLLKNLRAGRSKAGPNEVELLARLQKQLSQPPDAHLESGRPVLECSTSTIAAGGEVHVVTDVTARHLANERIRHMALHDSLTGLGNRALFNDSLETLLNQENQQPFAVLSIDLTGLRRLNDTLGQEIGDQLLVHAAERVRAILSADDLLTRGGGGGFAVLTRCSTDVSACQALAASIVAAFEQAFVIAGQQLRLSVAIGIALHPEHGASRTELVRSADLALFAAMSDPAAQVRFFLPEMVEQVEDRLRLEDDLRAAIAADELFLEFQPQFRTSSLEVVGFEALARWKHPTRGRIRPDIFIPLAEETGMVIAMGRTILEKACVAAQQWPEHIRIGVNLSPVQFRDPDLINTVIDVLNRTGLAASRLELEVTEGVLIADEKQALDTLSALHELGVGLALDDFGTGYASLSYLRKFPFERIKLDRSFVQAQVLDDRSRQILQSILGLARKLGLGVIAEGVETRTQLHLLRQQGCQDIQGFLVGKPMPSEETQGMITPTHPTTRAQSRGGAQSMLSERA